MHGAWCMVGDGEVVWLAATIGAHASVYTTCNAPHLRSSFVVPCCMLMNLWLVHYLSPPLLSHHACHHLPPVSISPVTSHHCHHLPCHHTRHLTIWKVVPTLVKTTRRTMTNGWWSIEGENPRPKNNQIPAELEIFQKPNSGLFDTHTHHIQFSKGPHPDEIFFRARDCVCERS